MSTEYTINEIWSHFTVLGMGMYGYYGSDVGSHYCMGVIPDYPREGHPLPKEGWVHDNKVVYCPTPEDYQVITMSDHTLNTVMKATQFDQDLYRTLHLCLGVDVETALGICLGYN